MERSILRLPYILAKYSVYQNPRKLTVAGTGIRISSNYYQSSSTNAEISKDGTKVKKKRMNPSSSNVSHVDRSIQDENSSLKRVRDVNTRKLPESFSELLDKYSKPKLFYNFDKSQTDFDESQMNKLGISREKDHILDFLNSQGDFVNAKSTDIDIIQENKRECRVESFNYSLAAYISVCMYSGFYESAYETFNYYRNLKMVNSEGLNLLPFNEVLKGIACQGDLIRMKEVMISLEESSLKPDYNTIAYCLTCLGRNENTPEVVDEIKNILKLMDQNEITLNEIIGNACFPGDSFHHCLLAIERVIPDARNKLETVNSTMDYVLKESSYNHELVNNLNKSLFTNQVGSRAEGAVPFDKLPELIQEQIDNELKGIIQIPKLNAEENASNIEKDKKLWEEWNEEWRKNLQEALNKYRAFMSNAFYDPELGHLSYFPYFNVLSDEDVIDVILDEIKMFCKMPHDWGSYSTAALYLGQNFYDCFVKRNREKKQTILRNVYEKYCYSTLYPSNPGASYIPRVEWNKILTKENYTMNWNDCPLEWPYTIKLKIGYMLFNFIFDNVKIWRHGEKPKDSIPGFVTSYENHSHIFKPLHHLRRVFKSSARNTYNVKVDKFPMLSPPVPWTNANNGGYTIAKSELVSFFTTDYSNQIKKVEEMYPMLDSLNFLGSVPWKVNCDMLDTIIKVFKNDGWTEVGVCPSPKSLPDPPEIFSSMTSEEEDEALQYKYELGRVYKIWFETDKNLSILNYFRDKIIWFPYHFDFRSRIHPISSHMNHMEYPDLIRSTLCFAQGKKLGKDGLTWIKLVAAVESGCPEDYISHLPIHQDGSCNVLQHFAALGRDVEGAAYVNLSPSKTPRDIYSRIVELVEAKRQEDARNGNEIARQLEGLITRKALKQSILIRIYGGTKTGACRSILRGVKELNSFTETLRMEALEYLDENTYNIFTKEFESFLKIRDWLRKIAKGISQRCFKGMEFETPIGFPVIQPYTMEKRPFTQQEDVIAPFDLLSSLLPDVQKQRRSFSPNFIQSLEASHMMLTSLYCQEAGITFVEIHDCYWTHAATVSIMNKICREQFVRLHSQPILENFAKSMIEKYSSHPNFEDVYTTFSTEDATPASLKDLLNKIPQKGEFNLKEVLRSDFFFS
ncbi:DNA-directed RNA polymerase, mitochondrial [Armadillidium nasatum]|uniref:DNA-directed RNA polymerase n=1 Tax=Armadillidium nasatum TaxID=96803 RepID=A0A5N5SYM7_9CRUS|nr:DNA-directed RNA polymerase, mitochondrial [Armadillidium nasatum]